MAISVSIIDLCGLFYVLTLAVDGDCGSWVMDSEDSILYGQVVAGYPGTKTAYIIPMVHIIEDIERLVWPVKIPTSLPKWVQTLSDEGVLVERMKTVLERSNESKSLSFSGRSKSVSGPRYVR